MAAQRRKTLTGDAALGTVARVTRLLRCFGENDGYVSVKAAADTIGLPSSTVHRLLNLLAKEGFVEHSGLGSGYLVGAELYALAGRILSGADLISLAAASMHELVNATQETCVLLRYLPESRVVVPISYVECAHRLRYAIALYQPLSLCWGATGRSVLAFLPKSEIDAAYASAPPSPATGKPLPPREELQQELDRIRRLGYAHSQGQHVPGAVGIGAPLRSMTGALIGALTITIPEHRFVAGSERKIGARLKQCADELSQMIPDTRSRPPRRTYRKG